MVLAITKWDMDACYESGTPTCFCGPSLGVLFPLTKPMQVHPDERSRGRRRHAAVDARCDRNSTFLLFFFF